ncbi:MAG: hypothetical protein RJB18_1209 [Pseudomonadota bacterium]|jgi:hypothetical protein
MNTFDPWIASLQEAQTVEQAIPIELQEFNQSPTNQWYVAQEINNNKKNILSGDSRKLIDSVASCLSAGLIAPNWLASAFLSRYRVVNDYESKSWDDPKVFGLPHPKGTQLQSQRKRLFKMRLVYIEVSKHIDKPIGEELFEMVGKKLHMGKTLVNEYYDLAVKRFGKLRPPFKK